MTSGMTTCSLEEQQMPSLSVTRVGLVLGAAMLLAACGVPDLTEIAERAVDAIEEADEPDEAGGAAAGAAEIEERPGRDTTLPIYPDAVRVNFGELTDTAFIVFYVSHDPLEDVIDFYVREIGDRGGVSHYRGAMGDGDYEFIFGEAAGDIIPLADHPGQNSTFILTLEARKEGTVGATEIRVMGSVDFFE